MCPGVTGAAKALPLPGVVVPCCKPTRFVGTFHYVQGVHLMLCFLKILNYIPDSGLFRFTLGVSE